ncbi:MAG: Ldh family oxidoreductase [Planctomycetia bacterium]|nr:Ldh family oxidoreductase [Planctomycetia bacterium]
MPTIRAVDLNGFAAALLAAGGLGQDEAAIVADSLLQANLRGHDSHGVMRVPYYLDQLAKGELRPGTALKVIKEGPALVMADGGWGFGQSLMRDLTKRLIERARGGGVCIGTLIHSGHVGRLGEYCEQAAAEGCVSMLMVNTHGAARRVAPPGGKAPRLGTNPLAIGAPHAAGPLVLDFGTSATAEGKVRVKRIAGQLCPGGWLLDSSGRPTNDPNALYADPPGTIRPMGGDQAYKGFGLALLIEVFAGALSAGVTIREKPINQLGNCVFMMVVDPDRTCGESHFAAEVAQLVTFVRGCPRIDGVEEILLPGDPERHTLARRAAEGIPIDDGNWTALVRLAETLGVAVPA